MSERVALGDLVQDSISGFKGIAVAYDEWLTGCKRFGLEALSKNAKESNIRWVDEERCKLIKPGVYRKMIKSTPAGPQPIDPGIPRKA